MPIISNCKTIISIEIEIEVEVENKGRLQSKNFIVIFKKRIKIRIHLLKGYTHDITHILLGK